MYLQLQCQCHCHKPISNQARKSVHHLLSPRLGKILQDTAPLVPNGLKMLKRNGNVFNAVAHYECCWGITVRRKVRNVRVMFKEENNNYFDLKMFRSCTQPEKLPLLDQYDLSFLLFLLPSPKTGMSQARTVMNLQDICPGRVLTYCSKDAMLSLHFT